MSIRKSSQHFIKLFSSRLFITIVNVASYPLILQYFGPLEYGKLTLFNLIYSIMTIFLFFTTHARERFGREEFLKEKKFSKTFWGSSLIIFPFFIIAILCILLNKSYLISYVGAGEHLIIILLIVSFISFFHGNSGFISAQEKFGIFSLLDLIESAIKLLMIVLIIFRMIEPFAIYLILMFVSNLLIRSVLEVMLLYKKISFPHFDFEWIKMIFLYSVPFLLHIAGAKTFDYIDALFINEYLSTKSVGLYSAAYGLNNFILMPLGIITAIMKPRMVSLYLDNNLSRIKSFYQDIAPQFLIVFTIVIMSILLLSRQIFYVLGDEYSLSQLPFVILVMTFLWHPIVYLMVVLFHTSKKIWPMIIANITAAVINVLLDFFLIPYVGIIGGSISTVSVTFIGFLIQAYFFSKYYGISVLGLNKYTIPIILMGFTMMFDLNFFISVLIYVSLIFCIHMLILRSRLFTNESIEFYEKIGISDIIIKYIKKIYLNIK